MLACLASVVISVSAAEPAPVPCIDQFVHTTWSTNDGAPAGIVVLAQTTDGYLWLGARAGLFRFDGMRFTPFAPRGESRVPIGGVRQLVGARDGSLWIVWMTGEVSRMYQGSLTTYGERDGLPVTSDLTVSSTGTVMAGSAAGLFRLDGGAWSEVGSEWVYPGIGARAVWFDRDDTLWAETEDRIVYLPAGGTRFLDPDMRLTGVALVAPFAQASDGTVWMAEVNRSAHTVPQVGDPPPLTEIRVGASSILFDRRGSLWVGSYGDGLRRVVDPTQIRGRAIAQFGPEAEQFTQADGLLSDVVVALLEDNEGNIWVATDGGLERFREGAFRAVETPGEGRARWIYASSDSSIWTASFNMGGLIQLGPVERAPFLPEYFVNRLVEDPSGVVWTAVGTEVFRKDGPDFVRAAVGRDVEDLTGITVDPAGTVWVFDLGWGVLRLSGDSLVRVLPFQQNAFRQGYVFSDSRGSIWIAETGRVGVYAQGELSLFGLEQGVAPAIFNQFFEDRLGSVWMANDAGLHKFDGGRFRSVSERQVFPDRSVFGIAEDESGAMWLAIATGVLRLPPGEMDRALADSTYVIQYRSFGEREGLSGVINSNSRGSIVTRAADGRIWVATDEGVSVVDPDNLPLGSPPPVIIEAVRVDGETLDPRETTIVPAGARELEIDYTATSLSAPEGIQFHYQLEGEDPEWGDVGARRQAFYTGIPPGTHRFRVTATSADGVRNEVGATWTFRVLPSWYQTWWFRVAVVVLIAGLGAGGAWLVQRRRHLRVQVAMRGQYEATMAERSRIAQDLHDTLLQGFAGVALQLKSAELALPEKPEVAAETILRVQRIARDSLREARERVWDMRESDFGGTDLVSALEVSAKDRAAGTGIDISVLARGERRTLPPTIRDVAFRIGREAVANAVRHAKAHRIDISVDFGATKLRLEVRDDGRGFTQEEGEEARRNGHFGLTGMRDRAVGAGGQCEVAPRPGGGTVVAVELPLNEPQKA